LAPALAPPLLRVRALAHLLFRERLHSQRALRTWATSQEINRDDRDDCRGMRYPCGHVHGMRRGENGGTLWAVHRQPGGTQVAYAGADGELAAFELLPNDNLRSLTKRVHAPLAGGSQKTHIHWGGGHPCPQLLERRVFAAPAGVFYLLCPKC
jgi:hypothetical protein